MNDDHLHDDLDLADAFRSVRETYDGTNAESNLTLQRALFRTRTRERKRRVARWVVLPAAAVLMASTAWAGVTGRLAPAVQSVLETFHSERTAPPPPVSAPSVATRPPSAAETATSVTPEVPESVEPIVAEAPPAEAPSPPPAPAPEPTPSQPVAAARPPASAHGSSPVVPSHTSESAREPTVPSPSASAPDPHAALFAEAHRLHFAERDPARALAAWDRYLAVDPNGRFAPEARYNRALALVRLGRHAEARSELAAFAAGTYGSYRRDDAKALLAALGSDASAP